MASPEGIDVDADEHPRVAGGTGEPDAPLEIASSDSEDEKPRPAKRAMVATLFGVHINDFRGSHFKYLQNTARATTLASQYSRYIKTSPRGRREARKSSRSSPQK